MELQGSLHNNLLIAMPGMLDPNFSSTVTLICEHNDEGALGIVINRPMDMNLGGLFEQLELQDADREAAGWPVLNGGPVAPERGFVLHDSSHRYESSVAVSPEIQLTLSRDVLDSIAAGTRAGEDAGRARLCRLAARPARIRDVAEHLAACSGDQGDHLRRALRRTLGAGRETTRDRHQPHIPACRPRLRKNRPKR